MRKYLRLKYNLLNKLRVIKRFTELINYNNYFFQLLKNKIEANNNNIIGT